MNLEALNTLVRNIADQTDGIERYFYGELRDQDVADNATYPALIQLITPLDIIGPLSQERSHFQLSISIIQPIIEDPDEDNWTPVYELTSVLCQKVYMALRQAGVSPYDFTLSNGTLQPILHWENTSSIVGWQMNLTVEDGQQIDCEPFSGSELCFAISEATWAAIKACMSAAQITAATDDLCDGGGGDVTLQVNGTEFTVITAPDTFDLPVLQDGSPVGSKVGDNWDIPSCPEYDLSIPLAPLTVAVDANKTINLVDTSGTSFESADVSAAEVGDDVNITLANFKLNVRAPSLNVVSILRRFNPAVQVKGSGGSFIAGSTVNDLGLGAVDVLIYDIPLKSNGTTKGALDVSATELDVETVNGAGAAITPDSVTFPDGETMRFVLPPIRVVVTIKSTSLKPTVGDQITITVTPNDADAYCVWFGDGASESDTNNTALHTYLVSGVYTVGALAGYDDGTGGNVPTADKLSITVDGIAEAYAGYQYGPALFRLTSAQTNCIRAYRAASATFQDIGFGQDGWLDTDALETFANGAQVFVNKVYHPTDSSRDCVQATPANMPPITDASGNAYFNTAGKPEWRCTGTEFWTIPNYDYFPAGDTSLYCQFIGRPDSAAVSKTLLQHYSVPSDRGFLFYIRNGTDFAGIWSNDGTNIQLNTCGAYVDDLQVFQLQLKMGNASANRLLGWRNNASQSTAIITGNEGGHIFEPVSSDIKIMGDGGSYNGGCSCCIVYNQDMAASQSALATNAGALIGLSI